MTMNYSSRRLAVALMGSAAIVFGADELSTRARQLELQGQSREAKQSLESAVKAAPRDVAALTAHAEFLDGRRDPETRAAYEKLLAVAGATSPAGKLALRRLTSLDLLSGNRSSAEQRLGELRQAGDSRFTLAPSGQTIASLPQGIIEITG
ncbi:MAG: hypothetical protein Q7U75_10210, partial [Desulfobacterales bacterium]|nr:hypothetical protein [Desulfobacterales bacterium]